MRKLKLQVQLSVDGFVGGPNGELDWMTWNWDEKLQKCVTSITSSMDTILLGRKMTDGFVGHWTNVPAEDPSYPFAQIMVNTHKVVFTKTLYESPWKNTVLAKGDIADEVNKLKAQEGKDIIVYGGANFVASLIKANLIDEYNLFVNPAAIGKGLSIFGQLDGNKPLKLIKAEAFDCGVTQLVYQPA